MEYMHMRAIWIRNQNQLPLIHSYPGIARMRGPLQAFNVACEHTSRDNYTLEGMSHGWVDMHGPIHKDMYDIYGQINKDISGWVLDW